MKKCICFLLILVSFTGCASEPTFETVADEWVQSVAAPMGQITVELPEEAVVPVSESELGKLYQCDGYEIAVQTRQSGDLDATLRTVTGYSREALTLMQTGAGDVDRWELVWSCMGETGDRIGRACVLDDGNYHYVLSVLADADRYAELETVISDLFRSYSLG